MNKLNIPSIYRIKYLSILLLLILFNSCYTKVDTESLIGKWEVTHINDVTNQENINNIPRRGDFGKIKIHFHVNDVYILDAKREVNIQTKIRHWPKARFYNLNTDKEVQFFIRNPQEIEGLKPLVKFQLIELSEQKIILQSISDTKDENAQVILKRVQEILN
jgi:hypothetical protein